MAFRGTSREAGPSTEHVRVERYSSNAAGGGAGMGGAVGMGMGGSYAASRAGAQVGGVERFYGGEHRAGGGGGVSARDFGFLSYVDAPRRGGERTVKPMVWDDSNILTEAHYHHGDHHHNHHQRHVHHYHDHHFLGTASETLDLQYTPQVETQVIAGDSAPQMKLRPDLVGQWAFEAGANAYWDSAARQERLPSPPGARAVGGSSSLHTEAFTAGAAAAGASSSVVGVGGGYAASTHSSSLAGAGGGSVVGLGGGAGREVTHYESYARSSSPTRGLGGRLP